MTIDAARAIVHEIFSLYEQYGTADYIGEPVSQLEHMCQAAELAAEAGADEELILAAFFHDIGHLCEHVMPVEQMDGYGVADHESLGAAYLEEKGFSSRLAQLVQSHVATKRYLTGRSADYYAQLSPASRFTLEKQGGVMNAAELAAFEAHPWCEAFILLRKWDDAAKLANKPLPPLDQYKEMAVRHLCTHNPAH